MQNRAGNQITFAYDSTDKLSTITNAAGQVTTTSYDGNGRLTEFKAPDGRPWQYSYDSNSNMTSGSSGLATTYNAQNQATSMTPSGGSAITMTYNGGGQRERWTNGSTSYHYDATGLNSETTSSGTTFFTNTPTGQALSERVGSTTYDYLRDGLGSVLALVDPNGTIVDQYSYDPSGNATVLKETVANPFRFDGAIWDSQTGLLKMGERYYDPTIGQWTKMDSLAGNFQDPQSLNRYAFVAGDPVNLVDLFGTSAFSDCAKQGIYGAYLGGAAAAVAGIETGPVDLGVFLGGAASGYIVGCGTALANDLFG